MDTPFLIRSRKSQPYWAAHAHICILIGGVYPHRIQSDLKQHTHCMNKTQLIVWIWQVSGFAKHWPMVTNIFHHLRILKCVSWREKRKNASDCWDWLCRCGNLLKSPRVWHVITTSYPGHFSLFIAQMRWECAAFREKCPGDEVDVISHSWWNLGMNKSSQLRKSVSIMQQQALTLDYASWINNTKLIISITKLFLFLPLIGSLHVYLLV